MFRQGLRFTLNIDGLLEITTAVVNFTLYQSHSTPFTLEAEIASSLFNLTAENFLEKKACLTIWEGDVPLREVSGIVTSVLLGESNNWQMHYHVTIHPPLWRAGLRHNFRIFQQQDIQTISDTLLQENDVTEWSLQFNEEHPPREFCVQYGESDLEFLTRLWSEEGIFFFEQPANEEAEQHLVLCDHVAGLPVSGTFKFNPNESTDTTPASVSEFRYLALVRPAMVTTQDFTFKRPGWPANYSHQGEFLNGQHPQYEIFDYPGRFKDEQHGEDFARYRTEEWRNDSETANCISSSPTLWPGRRFTLAGHPSATLNRQWQVVSSTLSGDQPQALHGNQGTGTTLSNECEVIPADRTWRSRTPSKPRVDGPQSAIVTGPAGEEIFCDEHGRVRVKFHWDRYNPKTEESSCWVRVSQAWAGSGFGNLAIPRIGQEVIVDFLNGDPDQPIIMGRTYHQDNRSPGSLPGTKTQMTIRSKTYKGEGFNELRFEDATGKEQLYMHAQKDMQTEVLHDRTTTVDHDHTETVNNNQTVTVGVGQTVNVGGKNEGGHDQKVTVAHDQTITVQNKQTLNVTQDREKNIGGDQTITIMGKDTETIKKDQSITVKENFTLDVAHITTIKSGDKIELKCGASAITLESSGKITISGQDFNFTAGGPVHINGKDVFIN